MEPVQSNYAHRIRRFGGWRGRPINEKPCLRDPTARSGRRPSAPSASPAEPADRSGEGVSRGDRLRERGDARRRTLSSEEASVDARSDVRVRHRRHGDGGEAEGEGGGGEAEEQSRVPAQRYARLSRGDHRERWYASRLHYQRARAANCWSVHLGISHVTFHF